VLNAGNLDTLSFLASTKAYFMEKKALVDSNFDYQDLALKDNGLTWKNYSAEKIIFCEGSKALENPFFKWLPFKLTKGELLTTRIKGYCSADVVNKGVFVLPIGEEVCHVGATYEWDELTEEPTEKGKKEILEKLEKLISAPYEVLTHQAGIRPTVIDRRPLIGQHPEHNQLFVYNGMGTKGIMISPYFAHHFAAFLTGEISALDMEVDIKRFMKP
jgi:glycine/D-amino acid oxidase-like deaminating enzyme